MHRSRGRIDGTGTSSASSLTSTTEWWLQPRAKHQASSVRTPFARMLPSVMGGPL
jgi:hypothetical protein